MFGWITTWIVEDGTKLLKNYILDILHTLHQKPMNSKKSSCRMENHLENPLF